jgi:two-component system CheB/CheR fusion protein
MKNEVQTKKVSKNLYIPTAEFYSQVIDSLQDYSIFTLDKELTINSWNSGATKIFQYETEEVIGKHFELIFTEEDKKNDVPKGEIEKALKEGKATDNRWHVCKDGSKFFAYGLVYPLIGKDGEMLGFVKILRDLTERRKSETAIKNYVKELEERNTHKENILAVLSHDLRSPLAGIIQIAEHLKESFDKLEKIKVKELLDQLFKASTDELNMLDYLVEWARIKYASEAFTPAKIELAQYVKKVFDTLNENALQSKIHLHNEIEEGTSVFADEKMLLSILQNIVSNSIKHTRAEGEITVTAKRKYDKIIVEIKDTGIGMSKEIKEKLFTPQISSLLKARKENKGAGIGLLLAKSFVEKNGGEIWVESIEGKGSSFYFSIPVNKPLDKIENANKIEFAVSD